MKVTAKSLWMFFSIQLLTAGGDPLFGVHSADDDDDPTAFSIAILPDTQYYTAELRNGKKEMFYAQTDWIIKNAEKEKIAYVIHLGDIVNFGERDTAAWTYAAKAMYTLEQPLPGFPNGIPYGMAVGNHDQTPSQRSVTGETSLFNRYFGVAHFSDKPWYGGHYGDDNDSHYDLFSAGGMDFIVVYVEYDSFDEDNENMHTWAFDVLQQYPERKAIVVSHYVLHLNQYAGTNEKGFAPFGKQAKRLYDRIKRCPNVFMMVGGHVGANGEGYRQDFYAGSGIRSFLVDYQGRENGGNGLMRLMKFSKKNDLIHARTFSPYTGEEERDGDSEFTMPWLYHTHTARYMDFDHDQLTDIVAFTDGKWHISGGMEAAFGEPGDIAAPADFNGDGKAELAVYRPSTGAYHVHGGKTVHVGHAGCIPIPADYDGDGFADYAVYDPETFVWTIAGIDTVQFGNKHVVPVPADYDGDGIVDVAVYDQRTLRFRIRHMGSIEMGNSGDIPLPGDYTGDGRAEAAVYSAATGTWLIDRIAEPVRLGEPGDIPLPGNYRKDGKTYPAVFRDNQVILQDTIFAVDREITGTALVNRNTVQPK